MTGITLRIDRISHPKYQYYRAALFYQYPLVSAHFAHRGHISRYSFSHYRSACLFSDYGDQDGAFDRLSDYLAHSFYLYCPSQFYARNLCTRPVV